MQEPMFFLSGNTISACCYDISGSPLTEDNVLALLKCEDAYGNYLFNICPFSDQQQEELRLCEMRIKELRKRFRQA